MILYALSLFIFLGFSVYFIYQDCSYMRLPQNGTALFLLTGILINTAHVFCSTINSILGLILGYCILSGIAYLYQKSTHKNAMGRGDFKLMSGLGAWFGVHAIGFILLFGSLIGIIWGILWNILHHNFKLDSPFPFGPALLICSGLIFVPHLSSHLDELIWLG